MGITVGELKQYLEELDDSSKVLYFDSELGEDVPVNLDWISIITDCKGA